MDTDLVLLERWRGGDRRAGDDLFARYFTDIYRFFENKVAGDAEDLTQRTFLACVRARDQFRTQSSFRTYLFAIARNELHAYLGHARRSEPVDFDVTSIAQIMTSLNSRLNRAKEVQLLRAALREIPAEQQLLLELHYWHELDADALSEVFDAARGTIRVRLLRARRALRKCMTRLGADLARLAAGASGSDPLARSLSEPEPDEPIDEPESV